MKRVTGIGGIFFKAKDAPALQAWYKRHLGIDVQEWGGTAFSWTDGEGKPVAGTTIWSIGSAQDDHFAPSTATFMVNYRVEDLHALVEALREEGCNVLEKIDDSEYGKFAWVIDPEGNKVELWQPPAGDGPAQSAYAPASCRSRSLAKYWAPPSSIAFTTISATNSGVSPSA